MLGSSKTPNPVSVLNRASLTFPIMGRNCTGGESSRRPRAEPPITRSRLGDVMPASSALPWFARRFGCVPPHLDLMSLRLGRGADTNCKGTPSPSSSTFARSPRNTTTCHAPQSTPQIQAN
jgi:hypothetical protein